MTHPQRPNARLNSHYEPGGTGNDDIDGGEAEGTVRFSLDGTEYEIDLSAKHSDELRDALKKYIDHARKVGGGSRRTARGARRPSSIDTVAVRTWAGTVI